MTTHVIMPVLGMSQDTGRIVRWLKAEGEYVRAGEMLLEVETDKAVAEIESPADGILAQILTQEGDEVPVAHVIAVIRSKEDAALQPRAYPKPAVESSAGDLPQKGPSRPAEAPPLPVHIAVAPRLDRPNIQPHDGRPLASPKAKRLAKEYGIALTQVAGSGPNGAILAFDIQAAAAASSDRVTGPQNPLPVKMAPLLAEQPSGLWKSERDFSLQREVCVARILAWLEKVKASCAEKITLNDLLILVVAKALVQHPRINAVWRDGQICGIEDVNVGFAVEVEEGLLVPVIHQANRMRLENIAARRRELVERACAGLLQPGDCSAGTFTLCNLGMLDVDSFFPGLFSQQVASLAVGKIVDRLVPQNGQIRIQPMMMLTASFDPQAVDGVRGALFLQSIAGFVEEPLGLI